MARNPISVHVSHETYKQLERYASAHGMKKSALVEQALQHYLLALRELPADIIVAPRLELSESSFERVAQLAVKPRKPTTDMRVIMSGK